MTSDAAVTLELHGFLARELAALGTARGTRTRIQIHAPSGERVGAVLTQLVQQDSRFALLFDAHAERLPEHVEVVLNDRVLELQGGLEAPLRPGDVLTFLPAHAGG